MKWTPVTDGVPKDDVLVLVVTEEPMHNGPVVREVKSGRHLAGGWKLERGLFNLDERVTHWMPLPDPPQIASA